ncbi:MAG: cell division suppressor protein YneA [Anaerovoracaceae bacterium]|jgi:nucleoid-associated protein YgaU
MGKTKKIRIKSKFRFCIFAAILLLLVSYGIATMLGGFNASGSTEGKYTTYTVSDGDTLWSIAADCKADGVDTREAVYRLEKVNHLDSSQLQVGDVLKVPVQ